MAKPCYSVEGTTTKKNSKIECVVGNVVASIKKVYEVTASGVTSLLWGGASVIKPLFKGVMYGMSDGSTVRLRIRDGETLAKYTGYGSSSAKIFTVSEDGRYVFYSTTTTTTLVYVSVLKYNEETGKYETYGSGFYPHETEVIASYWSYSTNANLCFKTNKDGSYFAIGVLGRGEKGDNDTCSVHLVVYKNNGSAFEYFKTIRLTEDKEIYPSNVMSCEGAFDDDMSVFAFTYQYPKPSGYGYKGVKILKRTSDNFDFTEIHSKVKDLSEHGYTLAGTFISRDGTYVCIPDITYNKNGYHKHLVMYISGTTATQILSKGLSYLLYYGNMVKSLDGKNLYFFLDSSSSSNATCIHNYSINGATITYLGELMYDKPSSPSYYPEGGYLDELQGGGYALIDNYSGVYFCTVSKGSDGSITSFANKTSIAKCGKLATFIDREF